MVIQMCQATNLAELMAKMQTEFGPDAVLLAVRRVDAASTGAGFVVEGTIGVKRAAEPIAMPRPKAAAVAVPVPLPKTEPILPPPAQVYEAAREPIQPFFAKQAAAQAPKPAHLRAATVPNRPAAAAQVKPVQVVQPFQPEREAPIPSVFGKRNTPVVSSIPAEVAAPAVAPAAVISPRKLQEDAKSNFLRARVNNERARERSGGKFGTHSIALVGPMGAGKTTTTAKIAGRFRSLRKEPVGVVSTDTDRPGGSTLLMAYAQELQLHGTTATTAPELRDRMTRWSRRGPLVIDTRGCSPRDSLAIERMGEMFKTSGFEVERYLVLSATEHPLVARECLQAFDELELNGVILTRVDQAAGIGHCLEEVRKSGLPIIFAGTGETVPQDLVEPTATTFRALEITAQAVLV